MSPRSGYRAWLALGPGGLPANVLGWTIASALRPLQRDTVRVDHYESLPAPATDTLSLPRRRGARPRTAPEPIPHRQLDQVPAMARLTGHVEQLARTSPGLDVRTSRFERRGPALFGTAAPGAWWIDDSAGELAHRHGSDGSWHVLLHPADARVVIEAGWGERHPLCGVPVAGLPMTYLLLYAPRDEAEAQVVRTVIGRAVAWAADQSK